MVFDEFFGENCLQTRGADKNPILLCLNFEMAKKEFKQDKNESVGEDFQSAQYVEMYIKYALA